eukprot:965353-Prorocentrum_minimum.AAC.1
MCAGRVAAAAVVIDANRKRTIVCVWDHQTGDCCFHAALEHEHRLVAQVRPPLGRRIAGSPAVDGPGGVARSQWSARAGR